MLNDELEVDTFLNKSPILSVSDLIVFAHVFADFQELPDKKKIEFSNVYRWLRYVQSLDGVKQHLGGLQLNQLDLTLMLKKQKKNLSKNYMKKLAKKKKR